MGEWRTIPGYKGVYQISIKTKEGVCRRLFKTGWRILQGSKSDGRIYWKLCINGKAECHQAARWIALTYPELVQNEYFEGAEIDHIDTDRMNNHPSNLRWVTRKENLNNPLTKIHMSEVQINNPAISKWIIKLNSNNEILHFYPSSREAERVTRVAHQSIIDCCLGKRKSAGGFVWKYAS